MFKKLRAIFANKDSVWEDGVEDSFDSVGNIRTWDQTRCMGLIETASFVVKIYRLEDIC